jgi:hypothetical protein
MTILGDVATRASDAVDRRNWKRCSSSYSSSSGWMDDRVLTIMAPYSRLPDGVYASLLTLLTPELLLYSRLPDGEHSLLTAELVEAN